ncbi:MAG: 3-phosphoshikimate 1-carboxyvinyltransferase [Anaerolineae bacterium]
MITNHLTVYPAQPLRGRVSVPGDKSISHRAVVLGALADGPSQVTNFLPAADCQATLHAIQALGIEVEQPEPTALHIHGQGLKGLSEPDNVLDCRRAGTAMRLLAGLLAGQPFLSVLAGEPQLLRRPMARIVRPLQQMGATILGRQDGRLPPLAIRGGGLRGIDYTLPVASAQVKSAILLAGLYAEGKTTIREPGPARDHTERMLAARGCKLQVAGPTIELTPPQQLQAMDITVPGDFSSAAFLLVAAALVPGSELIVEGVGVNPTRTGLLDILRAMGADMHVQAQRSISGEPVADLVMRASELHGTQVSGELVVRTIDEFPILAVAATQARGETIVRDAAELRVKETDRIATTVGELRRLGAQIEAQSDGFVVHGPSRLQASEPSGEGPALVNSHNDHRLAMALAVAGLVAIGRTRIMGADCINDSFPGFELLLARLQGSAR